LRELSWLALITRNGSGLFITTGCLSSVAILVGLRDSR
jgi:hypothetical protein